MLLAEPVLDAEFRGRWPILSCSRLVSSSIIVQLDSAERGSLKAVTRRMPASQSGTMEIEEYSLMAWTPIW